ncbi:MAG: long-chain fatty acid--CoA ligase [Cyanothece sp. SIO2G6]|nr:long-chain fatty acid--CoA ligase [Cyanothece sp. SIO2G6]
MTSTTAHTPIDYRSANALPEVWAVTAKKFGDRVTALLDPHSKPAVKFTYSHLYDEICRFAAGLQALGVNQGDRIALFSENSPYWFVADQGIMAAGGADAVRSSIADRDELLYILENSGSTGLVVENVATFNRLQDALAPYNLKFIILLSDETLPDYDGCKLFNWPTFQALAAAQTLQPVSQTPDDLATLIYTSGTSGRPKGVMLTHGNLLFQINSVPGVVTFQPGERVLSLLPSWHSYERSFEYAVLAQGCSQVYTSIRYIKKDLKAHKPQYMVGVPRIWESIYEGVQKQLREQPESKQKLVQFLLSQSERYVKAKRTARGINPDNLNPSFVEKLLARLQALVLVPIHAVGDRLVYKTIREATGGEVKYLVSGGGSFAKHLDLFYEIIGVEILQGYGLTETSPITNVRRPERNFRSTSGPALPQTEIRIVDLDTGKTLPPGKKGLILIRGPQVMQGYYKNPEATAKAIDPDGWFNSGDLGWLTPEGDLTITGRAKDTIVLSNGENIEPQPLEDACTRSAYVDQMMVVGQDQKVLGALIVPNLTALSQWATSQQLRLQLSADCQLDQPEEEPTGVEEFEAIALNDPRIQALFRTELNREIKDRPGYRADDRIGPFVLIEEPFAPDRGTMTQTLKIKRPVVTEKYQEQIVSLFQD